jgi:hypothetical protein
LPGKIKEALKWGHMANLKKTESAILKKRAPMKKLISLITCVALSMSVFSQSKFEIGLYGSKNFSRYTSTYYQNSDLKANEYSSGLRTTYNLNTKANFQLGLLYTRMFFGQTIYGWCATPPVTMVDLQAENMEIQSTFRYKFLGEKRISPFASFGITQFIKTRDVVSNKIGPDWTWKANGLYSPKYNIAMVSSVGLRFKFNQTVSVDLEPSLKYFILKNTIYKNNISPVLGMTLNCKI